MYNLVNAPLTVPVWSRLGHILEAHWLTVQTLSRANAITVFKKLWFLPVWHLLHQVLGRQEEQEQHCCLHDVDADFHAHLGCPQPGRWMGRFPGGICLLLSPKQSFPFDFPKRQDWCWQPSGDGWAPEGGSDINKIPQTLRVWGHGKTVHYRLCCCRFKIIQQSTKLFLFNIYLNSQFLLKYKKTARSHHSSSHEQNMQKSAAEKSYLEGSHACRLSRALHHFNWILCTRGALLYTIRAKGPTICLQVPHSEISAVLGCSCHTFPEN